MTFRAQQIDEESVWFAHYLQVRQDVFPRLKQKETEGGVHIGLFHDEELVAGATLLRFCHASDDDIITDHWQINEDFGGVRISRLWTQPQKRALLLPQLFAALYELLDEGSFIYGVLSFPLDKIRLKERFFADHLGWLTPRHPLEACRWEQTREPSSEGEKLFSSYLMIGASVLGPPSGDEESQTVRAVLGMSFQEISKQSLPFEW